MREPNAKSIHIPHTIASATSKPLGLACIAMAQGRPWRTHRRIASATSSAMKTSLHFHRLQGGATGKHRHTHTHKLLQQHSQPSGSLRCHGMTRQAVGTKTHTRMNCSSNLHRHQDNARIASATFTAIQKSLHRPRLPGWAAGKHTQSHTHIDSALSQPSRQACTAMG